MNYKRLITRKNLSKALLSVVLLICSAMLILQPEIYVQSSMKGITLWAVVVLPSLLPFFFLTSLMSATGIIGAASKLCEKPAKKIFRCGGISAYVFIMSILSGYPVGAKIISDLKFNGIIGESEATRLSTFCSTSGPLFIIGSVGIGMFQNKIIGFILIISHIIAAVLCGITFRFYGKDRESMLVRTSSETQNNVLYNCVYSSVVSVALVGGFICVFYVFADMILNLKITMPLEYLLSLLIKNDEVARGFISGLIECTRGCQTLAKCQISTYSVAFAGANISFGGISVIAQSLIFLQSAKANVKIFILSKCLQAAYTFILCALLFNLFF